MGRLKRLRWVDLRRAGPSAPDLARDARSGLCAEPKRMEPVHFYDARGSALFERITATPEYYVTRTEAAILRAHAASILGERDAPAVLVELGSGSSAKTETLIAAILARRPDLCYVPIDISRSALSGACGPLLRRHPGLRVRACAGSYQAALSWLSGQRLGPALYLFLGSSIGNFRPEEARGLLRRVASTMREGDALVLGADLHKAAKVLEAAYNDASGATAAFNLNLLRRLNRELGAAFRPADFQHRAFYDPRARKVEMHLESRRAHAVRIAALATSIGFRQGETIHTEDSRKYELEELSALAAAAGLRRRRSWLDRRRYFSVSRLEPA